MAKSGKEVKARVAQDQLPQLAGSFEQDAGSGFEAAKSRDDFAIPFLTILQALSPQVDTSHAEHIEGARPGMLLNTVTKQLATELNVIPVRYTRSFIEWVPRDKGGGFRGEFAPEEREEEFKRLRDPQTGRAVLENGNELSDTRNFYVLIEDPDTGGVSPAIISMGSTQIKKARTWLTLMNTRTLPGRTGLFVPAMYANKFRLSAMLESNKKGKWFGWRIEWVGFVNDSAQYERGKLLNHQVSAGTVTVDRTTTEAPIEPESEPDEL